jgi:hypothetical protein
VSGNEHRHRCAVECEVVQRPSYIVTLWQSFESLSVAMFRKVLGQVRFLRRHILTHPEAVHFHLMSQNPSFRCQNSRKLELIRKRIRDFVLVCGKQSTFWTRLPLLTIKYAGLISEKRGRHLIKVDKKRKLSLCQV